MHKEVTNINMQGNKNNSLLQLSAMVLSITNPTVVIYKLPCTTNGHCLIG